MVHVSTRQLLEGGVHFGRPTRRWNPKMRRFTFTERNGIYIIDLQQSLTYINRAYAFVKDTVSRGGQIMFVGTKKQAQEAIAEQATRVGMPFVNQRWLGGTLTNFQTVIKRVQRLKELEGMDFDDVAGSGFTEKELLGFRGEKDKLEKAVGGLRNMVRVPQALWVVDIQKDRAAVDEARKLKIPVIGIVNTSSDPDLVDFVVPGNDDAIRSVALLTRVLADAVAEGLVARSDTRSGINAAATNFSEPMLDWERELLAASQERAPAEPAYGEATGAVPVVYTAPDGSAGWERELLTEQQRLDRQPAFDLAGEVELGRPKGTLALFSLSGAQSRDSLEAFASSSGMTLNNLTDSTEWVLAFRIMDADAHHPVTIRVVRSLKHDGVDIELAWAGHAPSADLINRVRSWLYRLENLSSLPDSPSADLMEEAEVAAET